LKKITRAKSKTVGDLKPWERNPRKISPEDLQALKRSLQEFGDLGGIVYNIRTKHVVGGHQRIKDLDPTWKIESSPARDKTGTVALGHITTPYGRLSYREVSWPQHREAAANLAANKIQGEWDDEKLAQILLELKDLPEITLTGFSQEEIDKLIADVIPTYNGREDEIPELPSEPTAKPYDEWRLGRHRILCGDNAVLLGSIDPESVDQILTDPPYGADLLIGRQQLGHRTITNDEDLSWLPTIAEHCWRILRPEAVCILFGQWRTYCTFASQFQDQGFRLRTVGVWDKKNAGLGDGLAEAYEQIHVYYKGEPKAKRFIGNVFECSRPSGRPEHPTEKPFELIEQLMLLHNGDQILDPFLGSGTTLIAAEKLGRTCIGMEIEPRYVDVAVKRWEAYTGKKATVTHGQETS
jgi:DNA modification methylase